MKKDNAAFVLGMFETGLGVGRSLGRIGIKVYGIDIHKDMAFYSRYIDAKISPDPYSEEFVDWLRDKVKNFDCKPVLYITSDVYLVPVAQNLDLLRDVFLINMPSHRTLLQIIDKYSQYKLARQAQIDVPATYVVQEIKDLASLPAFVKFPVFMKGLNANEWRAVFGGSKKGMVCENMDDLYECGRYILNKSVKILIQELVPGPDTNHFKFNAYYGPSGKLAVSFCLQKIRQNPVRFGIGSCVASIENKELENIGEKFFSAIQYRGVGSAEFKRDERDGRYKLIELNPRYWQQNSLATACGINFPLIQYLDLTGQGVPERGPYRKNIKWINIYSDFDSFLSYRREGLINVKTWFQSLKGKKVLSDWSWDDLLPGFYELGFGKKLLRLPKYFFKKLKKQ